VLVNRVLTAMTGAVLEHGGTVDKFIGDCVMAFWNAPLDDPEHARHACRAALALVRAAEIPHRHDAQAGPDGQPMIRVGVGVNTGRASVGNFGSADRFDYTALGDAVNLASRLEGLSRVYGCPVVVGEATIASAQGFAAVVLDTVHVKGRQQAERVYGLLGDETLAGEPRFLQFAQAHQEMLDAYGGGEAGPARSALDAARALAGPFGLGPLYDLYQRRIEQLGHAPDEAAGGLAAAG
jgi:adenylate cyclase